MEERSAGTYLAELRKRRSWSLTDITERMGSRGLSKQVLSLIENGRMKIPRTRLELLKKAYGLSASESQEFRRRYTLEQLIPSTGEDIEFAEGVLSIVDPTNANSIYVIGGRTVAINSVFLQRKAAEFLENPRNRLTFIYPDCANDNRGDIWYPNSDGDVARTKKTIEAFSKRAIRRQMQFCPIEPSQSLDDRLSLELISLCSPVTAMTLVESTGSRQVVGYVYVEGPTDRWVLLGQSQAKQVHNTIKAWMRTHNTRSIDRR